MATKRRELLGALPWAAYLDPVRFAVLLDMAFNLGMDGLLGFKRTLAAVADGRYLEASRHMLDSKWATQVPARARRLATMMETGAWPSL